MRLFELYEANDSDVDVGIIHFLIHNPIEYGYALRAPKGGKYLNTGDLDKEELDMIEKFFGKYGDYGDYIKRMKQAGKDSSLDKFDALVIRFLARETGTTVRDVRTKLDESKLYEAKEQTVGLIFGRFNPPHKGHKAAWEMASKNDHWYVGTNQNTQGPKDPMPYDVKVKAMEAVMPEIAGHIVPHQSWLTLASKIYEDHGKVVLRAYTDEKWVTKALVDYNGVSKPDGHGFYDFAKIEFVTTPRLSSATAVRDAVAAGDREAFEKAAGVPASFPVNGKEYFDVVSHYLSQHQK